MKQSLVLALAAAVALSGCGDKSKRRTDDIENSPKKVAVATAQKISASSQEEHMGTVIARNRADIGAKIQAPVERITVVLGSRVKQGDLLAELDQREYQARADQAQAVYDQAARDFARFEGLVKQQAVTEQEFENVRSRRSVAEAALSEAKTYLSYTRITAPFSGMVTQRQVDVGDLATPGKTLFTMEESGASRFVVTLPEARLGHIEVGDSVTVTITSINSSLKGRVDELSPSADPVSRTFTAKIGLPSAPGLRPGQFGRLQLSAGGDETIFIPRVALVKRGQLDLVYVVNAESRAMLRLVRVGRQFPDRLEILAGLRENERVVTDGQRDLSDGDSVEVNL